MLPVHAGQSPNKLPKTMKPIGLTDNCIGKPIYESTPKPVRGNRPGPVSLPKSRKSPPVQAEEQDADEPCVGDELKTEFQSALLVHAGAESALTEVVAKLIDADVDRDTVLEWGLEIVAKGQISEGHVRSTVSRLFSAIEPKRAKGGGRKKPADLDSLINYATERFGDKAESMLLAAYRAMKAKAKEAAKAAKSDDDDGE